ncbi:DUF1993 family protein [Rheinheimera sp.]|uniref:DUF1993 family protein n=1 Tax=Rheinheimera sp. TaxID=1869214 RepID=UPI00307EEA66
MLNPVQSFIHPLHQLEALVQRIATERPELWSAQLSPDMLPLWQQARTAAGFSLRACYPLAALETPAIELVTEDWHGLIQFVQQCQMQLQALAPAGFADWQQRPIEFEAGFARQQLTGLYYLQLYALPNFYFHFSMLYAIARQHGMVIGKADFDGWHQYPAGFSWVAE